MDKIMIGEDAVKAWDRSVKFGHVPVWIKTRIRRHAIAAGKWRGGCGPGKYTEAMNSFGEERLLDHYGSVLRGSDRAFFSMPYHNDVASAKILADALSCDLEVITPGPWHPKTTCFIWTPKKLNRR